MGRQLVYALANSNVNSLLLTYFNLEKTLSARKICDETLPKYINKISFIWGFYLIPKKVGILFLKY